MNINYIIIGFYSHKSDCTYSSDQRVKRPLLIQVLLIFIEYELSIMFDYIRKVQIAKKHKIELRNLKMCNFQFVCPFDKIYFSKATIRKKICDMRYLSAFAIRLGRKKLSNTCKKFLQQMIYYSFS